MYPPKMATTGHALTHTSGPVLEEHAPVTFFGISMSLSFTYIMPPIPMLLIDRYPAMPLGGSEHECHRNMMMFREQEAKLSRFETAAVCHCQHYCQSV